MVLDPPLLTMNGQTTSPLRFNTFNTKQTYNKSISGSKDVAAVTHHVGSSKRVLLNAIDMDNANVFLH